MSAVLALPLRIGQPDAIERAGADTVKALVAAMELRDPLTAGHQHRVADLALDIGRVIGLTRDRLRGLALAASIHDIGKLGVPVEILAKPGPLLPAEYEVIKTHAEAGARVLTDITFPWPLREIVWQHHERLDGSGYPRRLKGDEIIPEARILAVADVVDAIASNRPYRPSLGVTAALAEIESGRGTRFDAAAVDACIHLFRERGRALPE